MCTRPSKSRPKSTHWFTILRQDWGTEAKGRGVVKFSHNETEARCNDVLKSPQEWRTKTKAKSLSHALEEQIILQYPHLTLEERDNGSLYGGSLMPKPRQQRCFKYTSHKSHKYPVQVFYHRAQVQVSNCRVQVLNIISLHMHMQPHIHSARDTLSEE